MALESHGIYLDSINGLTLSALDDIESDIDSLISALESFLESVDNPNAIRRPPLPRLSSVATRSPSALSKIRNAMVHHVDLDKYGENIPRRSTQRLFLKTASSSVFDALPSHEPEVTKNALLDAIGNHFRYLGFSNVLRTFNDETGMHIPEFLDKVPQITTSESVLDLASRNGYDIDVLRQAGFLQQTLQFLESPLQGGSHALLSQIVDSIGPLAFGANAKTAVSLLPLALKSSPYTDTKRKVAEAFIARHKNSIHKSLSVEASNAPAVSPLQTVVLAGGLGTVLQLLPSIVMSVPESREMIIEIDTPTRFWYHPVFVCPVLRVETDSRNPSCLLQCGHAVSLNAYHHIIQIPGRRGFVCPYCGKSARMTSPPPRIVF